MHHWNILNEFNQPIYLLQSRHRHCWLVVHALILFLTTARDVSSFSVNFPYLVNEERVSLIIQCLYPFSV